MATVRNTTRRDRHRRIIARDKPDCGICGNPIEYTIKDHLDPASFTVDHIIPLNKAGTDTIDNKQAAHRACNRLKSDKIPLPAGATYITERRWT